MNFVEWNTLEFKKQTGKEKLRCPNCEDTRSDKKDKSLLVNHNDGYGKCFYCEALTFKTKIETEVKYTLPSQDWKNHTKLSDAMVKFIEDKRKISQDTLVELGITEEKYYQPSAQKELNNTVFNYFEGETLVNKKYRSADKRFTQSTGGKSIFYNINSIIDSKECYIVEGEFDVLALTEIGIRNAISVPNGANDNDEYWKNSEKYLKSVEKFIIATDNDTKGNDLKDKIAHRLGRYRCEYIEWENKDANGDLIAGKLRSSVLDKKRFPVSGTFTVSDLKDDIFDLYEKGIPDTISPKKSCFGDLKNVFSMLKGHLCTVTGIPSHGKSNFTEWYTLNIVDDYNMKASFFSPEHDTIMHQANFIQKAVGKPFYNDIQGMKKVTKEDINRYIEWANEKLYITMPEGGEVPTWDWILEKFKEQMITFGINIFVVDAFNKVLLPKGMNKKDAIDEVLTKLTSFAKFNNVIVFLVAHPTKMRKDESGVYAVPDLYDVSGSSDFRNQTHDGFCVHRDFEAQTTTFYNLKTKMSFQGEIGKEVVFQYHLPTGRYFAEKQEVPLFDMTKGETQEYVKSVDTFLDEFDKPENIIHKPLPF
jgi:twinkle protein